MASLLLTYILWLFGGFVGLHHLYLGRPYHAFIWYSTLGGVFGLGWFRDLWRIPEYVRISNADKVYRTRQLNHIGRNPRPGCGMLRIMGMYIMGFLTSTILCGLLPNYEIDGPGYLFYRFCTIMLTFIGSSLGVYIVANVGEKQCSLKYPVLGALVSIPWLIYSPENISMASTLAMLATWWWGLRWRPIEPLTNHRGTKTLKFILFTFLWTSALFYGIYFNASIGSDSGERIPVRVALANFFSSPAWQHTKESFYQMYDAYMEGGWDNLFDRADDLFDFSGEVAAFKIIGLEQNATSEVITKKCRKLSAQSHPDRFKKESEKQKAQERFIEIQDACSTLNKYRSKRRSDDDDEERL